MSNIKNKINNRILNVTFGGHSVAGQKSENQDAIVFRENSSTQLTLKGHIGVIADGVSSANYAKQASQLAACHFVDEYLATPETWSVGKSASKVISSLNQWLFSRQRIYTESGDYQQWFTTFSAIVLRERKATIFHIGDCEIAKINKHGYEVLTTAHSTNQGVLNRALGASSHVEIDVIESTIEQEDIFFLSCDGVHEFIKPKAITDIIAAHDDLKKAAETIVETALENGSHDNLTCLLIKIQDVPNQEFGQLLFDRQQQVIPPALPVGATLDHFKVTELYDQSARSHIYLATDQNTNQEVILKIPSLYFSDDKNYLDAFIKEGWIGQQINHPSVMKIYPPSPNSKFLYHTCQPINGITLEQWHSDHPYPTLDEVKKIAKDIVSSLRALQRKDITHGDIKLDNFMIDSDGLITLIDLGSCEVGAVNNNTNIVPLGTLTYSAPERFYGAVNTVQSDLFSLGAIVYQLLSNKLPYAPIGHIDKAPKNFSDWNYQPICEAREDLSPWIDVVLGKAVAADPNNRYESYSEFLTDLSSPSTVHYHNDAHRPLIDRDPVSFWKLVSAVLFVCLVTSIVV